MPSRIQRTDRNRVSSIPSRLVGSGAGSHLAAAVINDLCAVGHDTPYSAATSETARLLEAIAVASRSRSRSVTRALDRTAAARWVKVFRDTTARRRPADVSATTARLAGLMLARPSAASPAGPSPCR